MGNEVILMGNQRMPNQPIINCQNPTATQGRNEQVFDLPPNLHPGDQVVVVDRNTGEKKVYQCGPTEPPAQPAQNNNFGNLTTRPPSGDLYGGGFDDYSNSDLAMKVAGLRRSERPVSAPTNHAQPPATTYQPQAATPESNSVSGDNIYDIAYQTAVQKLTKELEAGKISPEQFIAQVNELKKHIKTYAKEEVKENKADAVESRNEDLTTPQQKAIDKYLKTDNKLFKREDFKPNEEISGMQEATKKIDAVGIVKTVKVLPDGTTVEITEDKAKEGFMAGITGKRGGWGTGIVGGIEAAGGVAVGFITSWTGIGIAVGGTMAADGARRINEAATTSQAFTAVITKPDGSKETITGNYREAFNNDLYKNIGIIK